jgi:prepilin-type N-terminal cleavage/methylation domain-containing protein
MKMIREKKGFTLIEIMVTIIILTIVFGMLATLVSFFARFYRDENSQLDRQENMRLLLVLLEKDVRMSNQSVDFSGTCYVIGTDDQVASQVEYCVSGEQVVREGVVVAREIDTFELISTNDFIDVNIQAIPDSRGKVLEVSSRIFLRKGQGDD